MYTLRHARNPKKKKSAFEYRHFYCVLRHSSRTRPPVLAGPRRVCVSKTDITIIVPRRIIARFTVRSRLLRNTRDRRRRRTPMNA